MRKVKARLKIMVSTGVIVSSVGALTVAGLNWRVHKVAGPHIKTAETAGPAPAALIFGAAVYGTTPCPVLVDRLETGYDLYRNGLVERLILSGDHGDTDYDEVNAMREYLEKKGVPKKHLFLDHAGFDTYDSLYRARDVFGATDLILVTQSFHLSRAVYIGRSLGLEVQGVPADRRQIPEIKSLKRRELAANVKAFYDLTVRREPVHLGPEISLNEDARATHD